MKAIYKQTPASKSRIAVQENKKQAREFLKEVLNNYKADMPRGSKRLCRWLNKDSIEVREVHNDGRVGGDTIIYFIG